jgi:hypothetical protein
MNNSKKLIEVLAACVFSSLSCSSAFALGCDEAPQGQSLWIRLTSAISTYSAKVGDPVSAVLTQDVTCGPQVLIPMGTPVQGDVRGKHKVGLGIRHETAALDLEFTRALLGPDSIVQMHARVEEVENAREHVQNGVIHGVISSDTFQGRVSSRLKHLPTWNPYNDMGLIAYKAIFPIFPEPEIFYPAGTDMRLKTTAPISSKAPAQLIEAAPSNSQPDAWIDQVPWRTTTSKHVGADVVNFVFVGSKAQVQAAFLAAGWRRADPVSKRSFMRNFYALLNNSAYPQEPLMTLLLQGRPEDMNWQKSLNSFERRDHLRIWEWTPEGANEPAWVSSSTHDTGAFLSLKYRSFAHHIAPNIDDERAKVVRDLNFSGCVESVTYTERPQGSISGRNATGDFFTTDGAIAIVKLRECQPVSPATNADPTRSNFKAGNRGFRYARREILTFRSDIWRANIIYGAFIGGQLAVNALRHKPGERNVARSTEVPPPKPAQASRNTQRQEIEAGAANNLFQGTHSTTGTYGSYLP